jgi:hypothetical protein
MKMLARFTGLGYLIIFITGFYGNFYVLEGLIVNGDEQATFSNIVDNPVSFNRGVFAFLAMALVDLILAWPLYVLLRETNKKLAVVSSLLRVINAGFFFAALAGLLVICVKLHQGNPDLHQTTALLVHFNLVWTIGLLIFGMHLLFLGKLILDSKSFPKPLGFLMILAGMGYLLDSTAQLTLSSYRNHKEFFEAIVVVCGVIGEFSFTIWLLVKGIRDTG